MSTRERFATYAVELTADENGSVWITVTHQDSSGVFSARVVTETCSVTYETIPTLSSEEPNISGYRRLFK